MKARWKNGPLVMLQKNVENTKFQRTFSVLAVRKKEEKYCNSEKKKKRNIVITKHHKGNAQSGNKRTGKRKFHSKFKTKVYTIWK